MDDNQRSDSWGGAITPINKDFANQQQKQTAKQIILGEINQIFTKQEANEITPVSSQANSDNDTKPIALTSGSSDKQTTDSETLDQVPSSTQATTIDLPDTYEKQYRVEDKSELNQNIDWEKYHRAWQNYYQKYYAYYFQQGQQNIQAEYDRRSQAAQDSFATQLAEKDEQVRRLNQELAANPNFNPQNAALNDLRAKIRAQAVKQGRRFRKSKHFLPIVATLAVVLIFLFLQFNQLIIGQVMAYIAPGNMSPDSIVIDPSVSVSVSQEPKLIIPILNIEAPVAYDVPNDNASTLKAMENGLAHYCIPGACAHPGEKGNTVISGHRTNGVYQTGDYKFIFLKLDQLKTGDIIYANYKGRRHTYSVTSSEIVAPSDTQSVVTDGHKPSMTLVTCTPIGSDAKRLLIHAEQIAPDPSTAQAPTQLDAPKITTIPGETKSFWQSLFGR